MGHCCLLQTPPTLTPVLYKAASHSVAHLRSDSSPVKMGSTVAPETSSGNSPRTLCKNPKTKNQYAFYGESLKSSLELVFQTDLLTGRLKVMGNFLDYTRTFSVESSFLLLKCPNVTQPIREVLPAIHCASEEDES
jgi:hypothetical protein